MKRHILLTFALIFTICVGINAQVPLNTLVQITKAEDARAYDSPLEGLMRSPNALVRNRAALAAGRIGDERAIPALAELLEKDKGLITAETSAFAIGEIESIKGAGFILKTLADTSSSRTVISLAMEAAGKIAAANPKEPLSKELGIAIVTVLNYEQAKPSETPQVIIRGLTAVLRARPDGAEETVRKFLVFTNPDIVATALNTLTRLRGKNANRDARDLLKASADPTVRSNAARLLGAAEDKNALDVLLEAAAGDRDSRVRVSAIRAIGSLKDPKAAVGLIEYGEKLLVGSTMPKVRNPVEVNELIEIATVLGRLLAGTGDSKAVQLLDQLIVLGKGQWEEFPIARMRVKPGDFDMGPKSRDWRRLNILANTVAELATIDTKDPDLIKRKKEAPQALGFSVLGMILDESKSAQDRRKAAPDFLRAFAAFKSSDGELLIRDCLSKGDVFLRATAAELLARLPSSEENTNALKKAFDIALLTDKHDNDAQLAILDALGKLDKKAGVGTFLVALSSPDYLVRKKAFDLLGDKELQKDFPGIPASLDNARKNKKDQVRAYSPAFGTKLGQVLNTDTDYRRALSRKNGSVKAVLTTEKGAFTIVFNPEEAPLTVDNWVKLARLGYFNGLEVHRVVPNFVMQDGDPRGDGNGGPGWSIRCEVNTLGFDRGAVGMALSGKDTGGSQWFVTHSPQPHLDGGYTVFGHVDETGMKVVDNIVRGDKILKVVIIGK